MVVTMAVDGPRACQESELGELLSLANGIFRAGTRQSLETDYPWVFDRASLSYLRIIKVDGKLVGHSPVIPREVVAAEDRFTIGIITLVGTHPDHRHRSYGSQGLRDCIRIMEQNAWPLSVLWTIEPTFPFYQNLGWEAVAPQGWAYHLTAGDKPHFRHSGFQIEPVTAEHHGDLRRLHEAERFRIDRSAEQFRQKLSIPTIETFVAIDGGQTVGYLMHGRGMNKVGLIEAVGPGDAVETLVHHLLAGCEPQQQIQVSVPMTPTTLGSLMEAKVPDTKLPIEQAENIGYQMMRINSLEKLLLSLTAHLHHRYRGVTGQATLVCPDTDESLTLTCDGRDVQICSGKGPDPIVLGQREWVRLVFGSYHGHDPVVLEGPGGKILHRAFPFYFPIPVLDHS